MAVILRGELPTGYGYGYDYGSGYGYGYGYGSGSGYGYGSKEYWQSTIQYFSAKWPAPQQQRLGELRGQGAVIAFWRSDATGKPANGGHAAPVTVGSVQKERGPLNLCSRGTLHATLLPPKWRGERWWIVAMIGETVQEDDKIGALHREIIGECL